MQKLSFLKLAAACAFSIACGSSFAEATLRVAPIEPGTRPELASLEARILAERGRISTVYKVLLHSPNMAHGWEQLFTAVRTRNSLPADLRELVIMRVAVLNRAAFEFDTHAPIARAAGVPQAVITAIRQVPLPADAPLSPQQRVAMRLVDTMTRDIEVPQALFDEVKVHWGERSQVDLVFTIAAYNMVSRFLVAMGIVH